MSSVSVRMGDQPSDYNRLIANIYGFRREHLPDHAPVNVSWYSDAWYSDAGMHLTWIAPMLNLFVYFKMYDNMEFRSYSDNATLELRATNFTLNSIPNELLLVIQALRDDHRGGSNIL